MKFTDDSRFYIYDIILILFFLVFSVLAFKHFESSVHEYVSVQHTQLNQEETQQAAFNISELVVRGKNSIAFLEDVYEASNFTKQDLIQVARLGAEKTSSFDSLSYADENGTEYGANGETTIHIADRQYFINAREKHEICFTPILSRLKKHALLLFSAPIFHGKEFKGVIVARYDRAVVNRMLDNTVLSFPARAFLIDTKLMRVVGTTSGEDQFLGVTPNELLDKLNDDGEGSVFDETNQQRFYEGIQSGKLLSTFYTTSAGKSILTTIGVPDTNLVLVKLFPVDAHQKANKEFSEILSEYQLTIIAVAGVAFGLFLIIVIHRRRWLLNENADLSAILESLMLFHTPLVEVDLKTLDYRFLGNTTSFAKHVEKTGKLSNLIADVTTRGLNAIDCTSVINFMEPQYLKRVLRYRDIATVEYSYGQSPEKHESLQAICLERDELGNVQRVLFTVQDLTDVYEKEAAHKRQLEQAVYMAQSANKAKTFFLANMSHDIRTPINGIMGMLHKTEKNIQKPAEVKGYLGKIQMALGHLLELVNDVLDLTKAESGDVKLHEDNFNMDALCNECIEIIENVLSNRKLTFVRDFNVNQLPTVVGSHLHLCRVLVNILDNAVKYTPDGGTITFKAESIETSANEVTFRFTIADTGIGMSEAFQKQIFDRFTQEDQGARTEYQGTGLGMAIVKRLVDLMQGTITLESKRGVGSSFCITVTLPVAKIDAEEQKRIQASEHKPLENQGQGVHVLLVEDNEINKEVATFMLEEKGYTVSLAENGEEAVKAFLASEENSIDLILMDIMMPVMNGYEATEAIRALKRADAKTVPIIAMTANAFSEDIQKAKSVGMNDYVTKPIDIKHFMSVLNKYHLTEQDA